MNRLCLMNSHTGSDSDHIDEAAVVASTTRVTDVRVGRVFSPCVKHCHRRLPRANGSWIENLEIFKHSQDFPCPMRIMNGMTD